MSAVCWQAAGRSGVTEELEQGFELDAAVYRRIERELEREGDSFGAGFRAVRTVVQRAGVLAACEGVGMGEILRHWWRGSGLLLERGAMRDAFRATRAADGRTVVQAAALMAAVRNPGDREEMERRTLLHRKVTASGLRR